MADKSTHIIIEWMCLTGGLVGILILVLAAQERIIKKMHWVNGLKILSSIWVILAVLVLFVVLGGSKAAYDGSLSFYLIFTSICLYMITAASFGVSSILGSILRAPRWGYLIFISLLGTAILCSIAFLNSFRQ